MRSCCFSWVYLSNKVCLNFSRALGKRNNVIKKKVNNCINSKQYIVFFPTLEIEEEEGEKADATIIFIINKNLKKEVNT